MIRMIRFVLALSMAICGVDYMNVIEIEESTGRKNLVRFITWWYTDDVGNQFVSTTCSRCGRCGYGKPGNGDKLYNY